jgi:DNA-binding response OmpR family regulator
MKRKRILVIEDDAKSRFALESVLQDRGYDVVAVGSAEEAEAKMDHHPFDAAVVDMRLPKKQGPDFARDLHKKNGDTRIIFVTAYHEDVHAPIPGSVLLIKPIQMDVLCKLL